MVVVVKECFRKFVDLWPNVSALAQAKDEEVMAAWAGLGYYARARNLLKCARVVAHDLGGQFPQDRAMLQDLPGIGPYTSAAVAAIAFGRPETVVDGNVERVMARMFAVETPLPQAKPELVAYAQNLTPEARSGDYAQAVMDLGATICSPKSPECNCCPWQGICVAGGSGLAQELPRKLKKLPKPVRRGIAYVAIRQDGALLLERRPPRGLLGGMLGWPQSDWSDVPQDGPPFEADWHVLESEVRHTFTHFHLALEIRVANVGNGANPDRGFFVQRVEFSPADLPTVMRKVFDVVSGTPWLSR